MPPRSHGDPLSEDEAKTLTVGKLREIIADLPDDMEVWEYLDDHGQDYPVISGLVRVRETDGFGRSVMALVLGDER